VPVARWIGAPVDEPVNRIQVMRDPEGNEFCLITRLDRPPT